MTIQDKITLVPSADEEIEESFDAAHERLFGSQPPQTRNPRLDHFWKKRVSTLCGRLDKDDEIKLAELSENKALTERHRLYLYLLMAIVYHYWNGYKRGRPGGEAGGVYPLNDPSADNDPSAYNGEYYGHNIAALAVDPGGRILDFDFNHNALFNSSAEHAEARLVRRLYSLAHVSEAWSAWPKSPVVEEAGWARISIDAQRTRPDPSNGQQQQQSYNAAQSLPGVTVYTSLEPCAQCSGVMALAQVKEVVYLQTDPGAVFVGRILRNLINGPRLKAPLPITGSQVGLSCFNDLNRAFNDFVEALKPERPERPFWQSTKDPNKFDREPSVTSFLCTSTARAIYRGLYEQTGRLPIDVDLQEGDWAPTTPGALKNRDVLVGIAKFLNYVKENGRRATPHNL